MAYRKCQYLEVKPEGARVDKNSVYPCTAPDPTFPPMPKSITNHWQWQNRLVRVYVSKEDCATCPLYSPTEARA